MIMNKIKRQVTMRAKRRIEIGDEGEAAGIEDELSDGDDCEPPTKQTEDVNLNKMIRNME